LRIAQIYLVFFGLMAIATGLAYLLAAQGMSTALGFDILPPPALADIRANYGGMQLGLGLFLLYCVRTGQLKTGLLLTLIVMAAVPLLRALSFAMDGGATQTQVAVLGMEIVFLVISLVLYRRTPARV